MRSLGFAAAVLVCVGCGDNIHESEDIPTDEIFPGIEVIPSGKDRVRLDVRLSLVGDRHAEWIVLTGGDRLEATYQDETVALRMDAASATSEIGPWQVDAPVTVAFWREEHTNAPNSTVTLPLPFTVSSPLQNQSYSRANDDILVEWSPSGTDDDIILVFPGNCVASLGGIWGLTVPDTGRYTIEAGTLVDPAKGGTCELWSKVLRRRSGTLDPAFAGGHIHAEWHVQVNLTSTP